MLFICSVGFDRSLACEDEIDVGQKHHGSEEAEQGSAMIDQQRSAKKERTYTDIRATTWGSTLDDLVMEIIRKATMYTVNSIAQMVKVMKN